jgi:capsule polysaccharide export protein KpsE/RkpR
LVQDNTTIVPLMEADAPRRPMMLSRVTRRGRCVMEDARVGGWLEALKPGEGTADQQHHRPHRNHGHDRTPSVRRTQAERREDHLFDSDAKRAYAVTRRFSEALIEQVLESKSRASRSAYQFIDAQVESYQRALGDADKKLREYRSSNPDAMPGVDADVSSRIAELRRAADNASMDLADVGAQERQLMGQLSQKAAHHYFTFTQANVSSRRCRLSRIMMLKYRPASDVVRVPTRLRPADAG